VGSATVVPQPRRVSECVRRAGRADRDGIWELYLRSGFLYPAKLKRLSSRLDRVRETLAGLLSAGEDVGRVSVRERDSRLTCSLSVVRAYERTWLVQHMASLTDPRGMLAVLRRTVSWMVHHHEVDYGLFTWRPGNRSAEEMLGSIRRSLADGGAGFSVSETSDYYVLDIATLRHRVDGRGSDRRQDGIELSVAAQEDCADLALALERRFGTVFCAVHSLRPDELTLGALSQRYRAYGLGRWRQVYVARYAGIPLAVALAEWASPGMNLSMFLNKYQILPLVLGLSPRLWRALTRRLLGVLCRHYARLGRDALVSLCSESERPLYRELGFAPLKQYSSLAIASAEDHSATREHLDRYHAARLDRRDR
jgi:hypothetical protein